MVYQLRLNNLFMDIFILHAYHHDFDIRHEFIELFSSNEEVEKYLNNHPEVTMKEVTLHELNPL